MTFTKIGFGLNARFRQNQSRQNLVQYQVPPTSRYYSICGIITPQKRDHIYVDKKQHDHRHRMVFWAGLACGEMHCEDTSGNRVPPSCQQEEWALQRPVQDPELRKDKRAPQRRDSYMGNSLRKSLRCVARTLPRGERSVGSFVR